ncbi:MAG: hypothetical protein CVU59_08395 [Deltaproteobacteria bacterium HGW-Deltaproteobacteria-17]|nr:MAG: hypothetical protein CVU59_08395 [Deltaproteobacteria bacterium HGW-Deltaproteobacteria-17]
MPAGVLSAGVFLLGLFACSTGSTSTYYVNTGVSGALPVQSGCSGPRAFPPGSFTVDGSLRYFQNKRPGRLTLRCAGDTLEVIARPFVTMKIEGPFDVGLNQIFYVSLEIRDKQGETLLMGSSPEVVWSFGAPLRDAGRSDSVFASFDHASVRVIADARGTGSITATYQGRRITKKITIR